MQLKRIAQLSILFTVSFFGIATNINADTGKESSHEALELAEDIGRWLATNAHHTHTDTCGSATFEISL